MTPTEMVMCEMKQEIESLRKQLEKAEECLKFYASNESWFCYKDDQFGDGIAYEDLEENSPITKRRYVGGKTARNYFKEKEGKNG